MLGYFRKMVIFYLPHPHCGRKNLTGVKNYPVHDCFHSWKDFGYLSLIIFDFDVLLCINPIWIVEIYNVHTAPY